MSLTRMGRDAETVRFLDDVDLTFSLDSRVSASQQTTSIELTSQPVVFRASYRDINLITTIVNKAITLYGESTQRQSTDAEKTESDEPGAPRPGSIGQANRGAITRASTAGRAKVLMSKEQVRTRFGQISLADCSCSSTRHAKVFVWSSSGICMNNQCCTLGSSRSFSGPKTGPARFVWPLLPSVSS